MQMTVPFIKPKLPEPEKLLEDIKRIYKNNYYSNNGPVYFEFKEALEKYLGQGIHTVAVSNATLGLALAIRVAIKNVSPEKKYIAIPSFTFAAGPLAIKWCGFEPLFFDVDLTSAQPGLESFQELLSGYEQELAGVLLINDFGIGMGEIDEWSELLTAKNIPFIIDSAPGFGSTYPDGKLIGGEGYCEVFSFHATKPFGIGEGGLITTKNSEFAEELESLKNFGFDKNKATVTFGMNAKITELDCAIGLRILEDFDNTLTARRQTYAHYEKKLEHEAIAFLPRAATAAIQFATIIVDPEKRPLILQSLKEAGVDARTYYAPAVHTFPFFAGSKQVNLANTEELSSRVISLPVHQHMDEAVVDYVCEAVLSNF